jgi:threonine aldolase
MIDLRSDTVTKPSPAMREAISKADVGDDVFGEDPSVNLLQKKVSGMLGKEAGLFVTSGSMGNAVAIKAQTQPGDEVILEAGAHVFNYESASAAFLSGVQVHPLIGQRGVITTDQIEPHIRPESVHFPRTRLISLENTHNRAGGTIFPIEEIRRIHEVAKAHHLRMHLDGARLWNASVATDIPLKEYAQYFDSISVCFSKGLGAPVGSLLAGDSEFIQKAHRYRKIFGGGMRQVGLLAAGALYAVEHNIQRLEEDHRHAGKLAEAVSVLPGLFVDMDAVQTNIIFIELQKTKTTAEQTVRALRDQGVLILATGPNRLRAVTHLDVSEQDIEQAIVAFQKIFQA